MTELSRRDLPEQVAAGTAKVAGPLALPWRRAMAFLVDMIIAGLPLWIVGALFFEPMSDLGNSGVLLGWAIALAYFGYFDSALGEGRSPGKHATGIAVVGADGALLSPVKATARALLATTPIFVTSLSLGSNPVVVLVLALVSGLGYATVYLILFNRRTGQALHDIVVGSVVVRGQGSCPALPPIWRRHWIVVGLILLLSIWNPTVDFISGEADEYETVRHEVETLPFIGKADVAAKNTTCDACKDRRKVQTVTVRVLLRRPPVDRDAALRQVVDKIFASKQLFAGDDQLRIVFARGFNFGVANHTRSEVALADVAQWRAGKFPQWKGPRFHFDIGGPLASIGTGD
jgi:uncharacterized RDD family membrane protein YckC